MLLKLQGQLNPKLYLLLPKLFVMMVKFPLQLRNVARTIKKMHLNFFIQRECQHTMHSRQQNSTFLGKIKSYIVASPDGIVTCKCHGKDLIEIKCPYSIRKKKISKSVRECDFLITNGNGRFTLSRNHK